MRKSIAEFFNDNKKEAFIRRGFGDFLLYTLITFVGIMIVIILEKTFTLDYSFVIRIFNDLKDLLIKNKMVLIVLISLVLFPKRGVFLKQIIRWSKRDQFQFLDSIVTISLASTVSLILSFLVNLDLIKIIYICFVIIMEIVYLSIRIYFFSRVKNQNLTREESLHDLMFENGKLAIIPNFMMLGDVLARQTIINKIENIVLSVKFDNDLVLGINGEWGVGKSTIVNLVSENLSKKSKYIIINSFSSWDMKNESDLAKSIFIEISYKTGYSKMFPLKFRKILSEIIDEKIPFALIDSTINWIDFKNYVSDLGKKPIIVIDEIDRIDKNSAKTILNTMTNMQKKIDGVIYLLSYNKEFRLSSEFILDKIIEAEVMITDDYTSNMSKFVTQLMNKVYTFHYNESGDTEYFYSRVRSDLLTKAINTSVSNLRDFTRFYNSIIVPSYNNGSLDFYDELIFSFIKIFYPREFSVVCSNKSLFINRSSVKTGEHKIDDYYSAEEQEKVRELFNLTSKNYNTAFELICWLFPIFGSFFSKPERMFIPAIPNELKYSRERRISNPDYFDLYVVGETSLINDINIMVSELIDKQDNDTERIIKKHIESSTREKQRLYFDIIFERIDDFSDESKLFIMRGIVENIRLVDVYEFFGKADNVSQRYCHLNRLFVVFINSVEDTIFINMINVFESKSEFVGIVLQILENRDLIYENRLLDLESCKDKLFKEIVSESVNIITKTSPLNNLFAMGEILKNKTDWGNYQNGVADIDFESLLGMLTSPVLSNNNIHDSGQIFVLNTYNLEQIYRLIGEKLPPLKKVKIENTTSAQLIEQYLLKEVDGIDELEKMEFKEDALRVNSYTDIFVLES